MLDEVLSESNTAEEMRLKLAEYFQSGTRMAWRVDPVTIYATPDAPAATVSEADSLDASPVLPGLTIRVTDIFLNVPRPSDEG